MHNCLTRFCETPCEWDCQCDHCKGCHENYQHHWTQWATKIECPYCLEEKEKETGADAA